MTRPKRHNEDEILPHFHKLLWKLDNGDVVTDKTGVKTVELLAAKMTLDPRQPRLKFNGRSTPEDYVKDETEWYDSMDLHVDKIGQKAKIWQRVCSTRSEINSNYGYLVYHPGNYSQYDNVLEQLAENPDSRRAIMIYTRPSMHYEHDKDGMSDFICTNFHHFFIRNGKLHSISNCRSQDFVFGFMNDFPWYCTVHTRLLADLQKTHPELECGDIIHTANSLHVYERHFDMLRKICATETSTTARMEDFVPNTVYAPYIPLQVSKGGKNE